jgi:hypothetical protein
MRIVCRGINISRIIQIERNATLTAIIVWPVWIITIAKITINKTANDGKIASAAGH